MPSRSHRIVKIEMSDAQIVAEGSTSYLEMAGVSVRQQSFVFLLAKEIDGVNWPILFHKLV